MQSYMAESAFWVGFASAIFLVAMGALLLWVAGMLRYSIDRVRQFFRPTVVPGPSPRLAGPSPFRYMMTCLGQALLLTFLGISFLGVIILFLWP